MGRAFPESKARTPLFSEKLSVTTIYGIVYNQDEKPRKSERDKETICG